MGAVRWEWEGNRPWPGDESVGPGDIRRELVAGTGVPILRIIYIPVLLLPVPAGSARMAIIHGSRVTQVTALQTESAVQSSPFGGSPPAAG